MASTESNNTKVINASEKKRTPVQEDPISRTSHDRRTKCKKVVAETLAIMSLDTLMRECTLLSVDGDEPSTSQT